MIFKKLGITIASLAVALSIFASSASAENLYLDGASPVSTSCSLDGVVKASKRLSNGKGTIELRYSPSCKTAWARIILDSVATHDWEGNASIMREHDGKSYSCQHTGGNGVVNKGQRSCYTPMVYDGSGYRANAYGGYYSYPNNVRTLTGSAVTAWY
ncbi:DUF2690 domain-containing protein [Peribacillus frigoritolerans]|jgi:lipopolysaccharide export system protein LptA|uniref:DUF2690 domain-containing protein n=1 Tax=Peribacillus frigoritolerans TaxID=450367 RepID=UPI002E1BE28B|nr:DUF2690 domain-containing protein [Peribacillus frigoritolerans]